MAEMTLDDFHNKRYHPTEYNCSHFVRDLWLFLEKFDIGPLVGAWNSGDTPRAMRNRGQLEHLKEPKNNCIAWFSAVGNPPHVGIYIENRIFHMTPDGPRLQPLQFVSKNYQNVKFYRCK